jgi:dTMP kinase
MKKTGAISARKSGKKSDKKVARKGKLIVLEGGDGSGKGTQTRLLIDALAKAGVNLQEFDFPRYEGSSFGKLCGEALKGLHGDFRNMSPYISSLPYVLDRVSAKNTLEQALEKGTVICNRYTPSNIAYQSAKLSGKEKQDFIKFIEDAEYKELGLPKPDLVIYLYVPIEMSQKLIGKKKARSYLGKQGSRDQHEQDVAYLVRAVQTYLELAEKYKRQNWHVVDCLEKGVMLSRDEIHRKIFGIVQKYLNK